MGVISNSDDAEGKSCTAATKQQCHNLRPAAGASHHRRTQRRQDGNKHLHGSKDYLYKLMGNAEHCPKASCSIPERRYSQRTVEGIGATVPMNFWPMIFRPARLNKASLCFMFLCIGRSAHWYIDNDRHSAKGPRPHQRKSYLPPTTDGVREEEWKDSSRERSFTQEPLSFFSSKSLFMLYAPQNILIKWQLSDVFVINDTSIKSNREATLQWKKKR